MGFDVAAGSGGDVEDGVWCCLWKATPPYIETGEADERFEAQVPEEILQGEQHRWLCLVLEVAVEKNLQKISSRAKTSIFTHLTGSHRQSATAVCSHFPHRGR